MNGDLKSFVPISLWWRATHEAMRGSLKTSCMTPNDVSGSNGSYNCVRWKGAYNRSWGTSCIWTTQRWIRCITIMRRLLRRCRGGWGWGGWGHPGCQAWRRGAKVVNSGNFWVKKKKTGVNHMFINKEKKQKCESNFVIVSSYQTCEETADNQAALSIDLRIIYGESF